MVAFSDGDEDEELPDLDDLELDDDSGLLAEDPSA